MPKKKAKSVVEVKTRNPLANGSFDEAAARDMLRAPQEQEKKLKALEEADCVCGWRQRRHDHFHRRFLSSIANNTRRWVLGDRIQDTGCSLKVFRANAVRSIKLFRGMHRFLPSLLLIEGFRVKEVPVSHRPRTRGASKYSVFNRGLSTVSDLFAVWWMKRRKLNAPIAEWFSHDA